LWRVQCVVCVCEVWQCGSSVLCVVCGRWRCGGGGVCGMGVGRSRGVACGMCGVAVCSGVCGVCV